MPGKIEAELLTTTGENPKRRKEDEQDYLRRLAYAADDLDDKKYDMLSAKAKEWAQGSAQAANEKLELPNIPGRRKPSAKMEVIAETDVTVVEEDFLPEEEPGSEDTSEGTSEPTPSENDLATLAKCDECEAMVNPNEEGSSAGDRSDVDGEPLWFLCAVCTEAARIALEDQEQQEADPDAELDTPDDSAPELRNQAGEQIDGQTEVPEPEPRMCECGAGPLYPEFDQCDECRAKEEFEPEVAPEVEAGPEATAEPEAAAPPAPEPEKKPARKKRPTYLVPMVGIGKPGDVGDLRRFYIDTYIDGEGPWPIAREDFVELLDASGIGAFPQGTFNAIVSHLDELFLALNDRGYEIQIAKPAKED